MWKRIIGGAIGGLAASLAMNQFQSLVSSASKALANGDQQEESSNAETEDATTKAAKAISRAVFSHELTADEKKWAAPAVHYGFGTLMGAGYGVLSEIAPAVRSARGTAFGSMLWLFADEVGVPSFGLFSSPTETPLSSHAYALASHVVYGAVTDAVSRVAGNGEDV